jgi:hypothetical protein
MTRRAAHRKHISTLGAVKTLKPAFAARRANNPMKYLVVSTERKPKNSQYAYLGIVVSVHKTLELAKAAQAKLYREALYPPFRFAIYELPWACRGYLPDHFIGPNGPTNHPRLVRDGDLVSNLRS